MATKKSAVKKKAPAKKAPAKKAAAKNAPKEKTPASRAAAQKSPAKKSARSSRSSAADYTKPELREKIKKDVMAGDKGGRSGQWSARKAQLVAHEYEAEGGGYKHARNATQKSLKDWGDEKWHTADGKQAIRKGEDGGKETHRYLPDEAWKELSPAEKKATDVKKVAGSRHGEQFVPNTPAAKKARKHATEHDGE